jgi:signal transduction histidine kinase
VSQRQDRVNSGQDQRTRPGIVARHAAPSPAAEPDAPGGRWLRYANLKVEAAIFLLILVTFAAVLGRSAITSQTLVLSPASGGFASYVFSDATDGGRSATALDPAKPLTWSCEIRAGVEYPYCGFGLQLNLGRNDQGLDLSRIETVTLRFFYRGPAERMRLSVKTPLPPAARAKAGADELPSAVEFPVVNGRNEVTLPLDGLTAEQWFVAQHGLSPQEATPNFANVLAIALITSRAKPGDLRASIDEIVLEGAYLSTEHWYLIILGVWLVLTGTFLVHRFFRMRREYEARQRRQAQEARILADARAAAEAASNAKSQFLGNMSHELRTPLNAVIGYAYWLGSRPLAAKEREAVKTIQSSGEHLLAVITDILDIAKIEAGKLELLPAPFNLHECVAGVGQMFGLRAQEKGLRFQVSVASDVPGVVVADPKRVRQVLINLLANAVKYTTEVRIDLQVSVVSQMDDAWRLRFVVEDTGVGIPEDQAASIFRPFEQLGDALDRSEGAGLGLSITHQIVGMMDGDIRVESTPGQGSRFTVEAMFAAAEAVQAIPTRPGAARLAASPPGPRA